MYVKLQSGSFEPTAPTNDVQDVPTKLDKPAMLVYSGNFESMDGHVEVKDEHIDRLAANHNAMLATLARMLAGDVPLRDCPPLQLDHSVKAVDTIGRVIGPLRVGEHTTQEGKTVKALYGTVRVLGKENVEKVIDGRWCNLSIGADLEKGRLQELTVTPFPAAPGATMLSAGQKKSETYNGTKITIEEGPGTSWYIIVGDIKRGPFQKEDDALAAGKQIVDSGVMKKFSGGDTMLDKFKAMFMRTHKLSEKDAEEKAKHLTEEEKKHLEMGESHREKMKQHLKGHKGMSEEDAEKHLSEMNMDKVKELTAEIEEHEKKMAAESEKKAEESKSKMSAAKESLTKLSTSFQSNIKSVELSMKKAKIVSRLSKFQSEAKITPAELKAIDMAKLAGENEATIEAVMNTYESRQPVILSGLMGSKNGMSASEAYQGDRNSRLMKEHLDNMPMLSRAMKNKLAAEGKHDESKPHVEADEQGAPHADMAKHLEEVHKEAEKHMKLVHKHMEAGEHEIAKGHLKHMMEHYRKHLEAACAGKHMGAEGHKAEVEMSALAETVGKMQNDMKEIVQLANTLAGA